MFIIYRGWGLALLGGAILVGFLLLVVTFSISIPLIGMAAFLFYYGRAGIDEDGISKPAPSVYFIPLWVYGILLIPFAGLGVFGELKHGRLLVAEKDANQEQVAQNDDSGNDELLIDQLLPPGTLDGTAEPDGETSYKGTVSIDPETGKLKVTPNDDQAPKPEIKEPELKLVLSEDPGGETINDFSELFPGEPVFFKRGSKWYPGWIAGRQSSFPLVQDQKGYTSSTHLSFLRRADQNLLEKFPVAEADPPRFTELASSQSDIRPGDDIYARINNIWMTAEVLELKKNGQVAVNWSGFDSQYDTTLSYDHLRTYDSQSRIERQRDLKEMRAKHGQRVKEMREKSQATETVIWKKDPSGVKVTDINELAPGQRVLAEWGKRWAPVDFVGNHRTNDRVKVAYVGSASYRDYPQALDSLRIVSADVLEKYPNKYNDPFIPVPGEAIAEGSKVTVGDKLLGQANEVWLPVEVLEITEDAYQVHYTGFDDRWDAQLSLDQLRKP